MARQPRIVLAGRPHLLSQSSLRTTGAFRDDDDRRSYLEALFECARVTGVKLHAYALSDQQVRLLATPDTADALGRFIQHLGRRYVRAFNRKHGSAGPLWSCRYGATALLTERFLLDALLMVEQLPVREKACRVAREWLWSSAAHHLGLGFDSRVVDPAVYWSLGNTPFERQTRYAELLAVTLPLERTNALERAARSGWPFATRDELAESAARQPGRNLQARPRGRPPKTAS